MFDSDKKGAITMEVIKIILEMFTGEIVDEEELEELMEEYDEDESGEIEFPEFIELAEHFVEPEPEYGTVKQELRDVFVMYDKQSRGFLPAAEFKEILKQIDPDVPEKDLDQIVDEIDADSSGTIDFDGNIKLITIEWFYQKLFFLHFRIHWSHVGRRYKVKYLLCNCIIM